MTFCKSLKLTEERSMGYNHGNNYNQSYSRHIQSFLLGFTLLMRASEITGLYHFSNAQPL
jgi:hypothetical protein